ncbi:MAG: ribulose-phosphate 3-epimerase [Anaerolineae bacterium]|nr:ribulose-phosphate 3-epimerase [Anaerolineae bacterium]
MERSVYIAPSILSADFARLGEDVHRAEAAGADLIHVDVMDGHFVPNITLGPLVVRAVRRVTSLPLCVHLMISTPERYLGAFVEAGAAYLTVHPEATIHLHRTLQEIRAHGVRAGVALNPATGEEALSYVLPLVDLVLVMTVNPGFGGQVFLPEMLPKIRRVRKMLDEANSSARIAVDGGIAPDTVGAVVAAGADTLVAGSAIFNVEEGVERAVQNLRRAAVSS